MPLSLIDLLRQRYLDTIRSVQPANGRWKVLVVDEHSQKLLNNVVKTFEILELGVQQIDLIESRRNPQTALDAVYILAPTAQNVDRVIIDFAPPGVSSSKPTKGQPTAQQSVGLKYAGAHLFFVDALDDALVNKLTSSPASPYLRQLVELFTNFWANEAHVFSLQPVNPRSFFTLYAPPERTAKEMVAQWDDEVAWISKSMINTLATLGENPLIRYYNPSCSPLGPAAAFNEPLCRRLAMRIQADMDEYCKNNPDFPPQTDPSRARGTLFITERAMDLQAPLLHEFTYQAMCNDLLDIVDGTKYTYSFRGQSGGYEEKEAILSEEDKVWVEVRHMHMKDALDKLIADFKAYAGEHGHLANGSSLNDMKDMLANLPHLRESKDKLSLHLTMAETCMELFEKRNLPLAASVEQCCATGMTPEGKTPKTIVEEMVPLLDNRSVSSTDKVRIIALYIMYRDGVPEEDKRRLYQHARLGLHEMDAVNNMIYLGANVTKDTGKKRKPLFKQTVDEEAYDISRYQPALKLMLDEHVSGKLDQSVFPYVRDAPAPVRSSAASTASSVGGAPTSLRSARPRWQMARSKGPAESRQRLMVFVAGGMTYSEVRAAYTVGDALSKDVIVGSTHIYTPQQFIKDLSDLDRAGGGSLLSHGAPTAVYEGVAPKKDKKKDKNAPPAHDASDRRYRNGSAQSSATPSQSEYRSAQSSSNSRPSASYQLQHQAPPSSSSSGGGYLGAPTRSPLSKMPSSTSSIGSLTQVSSDNSGISVGSGGAASRVMDEKKKKGFFGRNKK